MSPYSIDAHRTLTLDRKGYLHSILNPELLQFEPGLGKLLKSSQSGIFSCITRLQSLLPDAPHARAIEQFREVLVEFG